MQLSKAVSRGQSHTAAQRVRQSSRDPGKMKMYFSQWWQPACLWMCLSVSALCPFIRSCGRGENIVSKSMGVRFHQRGEWVDSGKLMQQRNGQETDLVSHTIYLYMWIVDWLFLKLSTIIATLIWFNPRKPIPVCMILFGLFLVESHLVNYIFMHTLTQYTVPSV